MNFISKEDAKRVLEKALATGGSFAEIFFEHTINNSIEMLITGVSKNITNINMSAFALLAIGGDLGCTLGPAAVGWIAEHFGGDLKMSFLISAIFPIAILSILLMYGKKIKNRKKDA